MKFIKGNNAAAVLLLRICRRFYNFDVQIAFFDTNLGADDMPFVVQIFIIIID